jgi:anti-sigma factor RsiW
MCEHSGRLLAWLDRELEATEMTTIERHVQECGECRTRVAEYGRISKAFDEYCTMEAANVHSGRSSWAPAISAIAAAAVIAMLAWISFRPRVERSVPGVAPTVSTVRPQPAPEEIALPASRKSAHPRRMVSRGAAPVQTANWSPEPAFQVAIPAESIFPPGAIPDGVNFIADVSLGPDGSPRQIRLQPQLMRFERRTIQP